MVVAFRRVGAGERDEMGLLRAGERLATPLLPLVGQDRIHPALGKVVADALDRIEADIEGTADLRLAPALAEFEQHLGASAGPGAGLPAMDADVQPLAVVVGQGEQRGSWCAGQSRHETLLSCSLLYSLRQLLSGLSTSTLNYVRDLDSPAVVRIVSEVDAQVICRGCSSDGSDYVFPSNPTVYQSISSGSGAFISSDGFILTADHVVDPVCTDDVNKGSFQQLWENDLQTNFAQYGFASASSAQTIAQNQLNAGTVSLSCQNTPYSDVFNSSAYAGPLQSTGALVSYKVAQIVQSSPPGQQDVAIIKVDVPHDMPYLTLAKASDVQTGQSVTAIAYPGDADQSDFSVLLNPSQSNTDVNTLNSLLSPSIDTGQITAQQTLSNGTLTYETSGIAYHGSSGGPAVDDKGRIVGFFDYTTDTASNRVAVMIASAVAQKYAQESGVNTPKPGAVMPLWSKIVSDYYGSGPCHYGTAYNELKQMKDQHPEFAGVQAFYLKAEQLQTPAACAAATAALTKKSGSSAAGGALVLVVLLLLIGGGIGGVVFFVRKRSARRAAQPVPVAVGAPYNAAMGMTLPPAEQIVGQYPQLPSAGYNPPTPYPGTVATPAYPPTYPSIPPTSLPPTGVPLGAESMPPMPEQSLPQAAAAPAPQRLCRNGHPVTDPVAQYCPICGAPADMVRQ